MEALGLESKTSLASDCEPLHIVSLRGSLKPISSVRWKKDSWMQHLYGAILKPSHTNRFTDWWTSSLRDTHVSHLAQQESEQVKKTQDIFGLGLQTEFDFFNQECASLKTSKDTFRWDSPQSSVIWKNWVTQCRGEYSARLKLALPTKGSGSSSWPTIRASEYKDTGPIGSKSYDHMLGKGYLCAVVTQDAANWPTPCAMEAEKAGLFDKGQMGQSLSAMANRGELTNWPTPDASNHRDGEVLRKDNNLEQGGFHGVSLHHAMTKYGQAAQVNHNTHMNHPESWLTPTVQDGKHSGTNPSPNGERTLLVNQVNWATPNAFCYQPPENMEQWTKRAEYQQTEKGVNLHKPIQTQVLHEVEKQWRTPSSSDGEGGVMEMREGCAGKYKLRDHVVAEQKSWATPRVGGEEKVETRLARGKDIVLHGQVGAMNNTAKLNPRWVETLMGLPVGWVMPSCASPVTIEPTNCDSSATESSLPQQNELF
jgi:hypothetical protein